jgi:hypothetical protein
LHSGSLESVPLSASADRATRNRAAAQDVTAVRRRQELPADGIAPKHLGCNLSWILAEYLGGVKTDRSRTIPWRLVADNTARERALICLTWIADPRDLPELGQYHTGSLDDSLTRAYGKAAAPYLRGDRR